MLDSSLDEVLAAAEKGIDQNPRAEARQQKPEKPKHAPVDPSKKVWVKCITENKPFINEDSKMLYWKNYEIPLELALIFEDRKHAVILNASTSKGK